MDLINTLLVVVQVLSALGVIALVLMQHGKGADMGAAFGSGSSGSLFGASGSANFLSRTTGVLATVFFVSTLALAMLANQKPQVPDSIMRGVTTTAPAPTPASAPAQPSDIPPSPASDIPPVSGPDTPPAGGGDIPPASSPASAGSGTAGSSNVPAPAPASATVPGDAPTNPANSAK